VARTADPSSLSKISQQHHQQDHRTIKRVTRQMLNFKSLRAAGSVLTGIELIHMIGKDQ
jgi:transposase-like protein